MTTHLTPAQTARALPYPGLAQHLQALLRDPSVTVPARRVQSLGSLGFGGSAVCRGGWGLGARRHLARPPGAESGAV
jgi:hypothetical protein